MSIERTAARAIPPGARAVRLGDAPTISVVVASCRERDLLDACLASLLPECRAHGASITVARATSQAEIEMLAREYPYVQFVLAPPGTTTPQLRALGLAAADGDVVALTEDHRFVASDWVARLASASGTRSGEESGAADPARRERAADGVTRVP